MKLDNNLYSYIKTMQVQLLSDNASVPIRSSEGAAGFDLVSAHDITLQSCDKAIVKTDVAIKVPIGTYGRIAPRSSLAAKHFIDVGAGVIDSDYTGNVGVVLFNHSKTDYEIKKGDRIAQLIIEKIMVPEIVIVVSLSETERGHGGYGSTGK
jgi:dUTP pyrophosphatase